MTESSPTPAPPLVGRPRLAPAGWILGWLCLAAVVAGAWRYDGPLLWLGGAGLVTLGLARWLAPRHLRNLEISRECPSRVFAGEALEWTLTVRQAGPGALAGLLPGGTAVEVRDRLQPGRGPGVRPGPLWPGDRAEAGLRTRLFRRGRESRNTYDAVSAFPLGLFETRASGPIIERRAMAPGGGLLVFPAPLLPRELFRELEWTRFELAFPEGFDPDPGGEFRGVRPYRSGDPVKSVHWSATARTGELMVREWDPPAPRPLRFGLLLHTLETRGTGRLLRADRWERCLRLLSGIVVFAKGAGIPLTFANASGAAESAAVDWLRLPEQRGYGALLEWAALAGRGGSSGKAAVAAALHDLARTCDRIFAVSDVPIPGWRAALDSLVPAGTLVCIDPHAVAPSRGRTASGGRRKPATQSPRR